MILQVPYLVPPEVQEKLITGEWVQHGGVIRNTSGQIMKHLKEVGRPEDLAETLTHLTHLTKSRPLLTSSALVATTGVVAGGFYIVHARASTNRTVTELNRAMTIYAGAVRDGTLSTKIIDRLLKALENTGHIRERRIRKLFGSAGFRVFMDLVIEYSRELTRSSSSQLPEFETSADKEVVTLTDYLEHQKTIMSEAS